MRYLIETLARFASLVAACGERKKMPIELNRNHGHKKLAITISDQVGWEEASWEAGREAGW